MMNKLLGCIALGFYMAAAAVQAAPSIDGNTIYLPGEDWYQVQRVASDGIVEVCQGGSSCEVGPGQYIVINHSTGQRYENIVIGSNPTASPYTVTGNTLHWPDDGWYQVQDADTYQSLCEGGTRCTVPAGQYHLVNHTTGQRYERIRVGDQRIPGPQVSGSTISWPDDGWYQVQEATSYASLCNGERYCEVPDGRYVVINHTSGVRYDNIVVDTRSDPDTGVLCVQNAGLDFCVNTQTREFSARLADSSDLYWSFVLPGQADTNKIVDITAAGEVVYLIAQLDTDSGFATLERSSFALSGSFMDTRPLLGELAMLNRQWFLSSQQRSITAGGEADGSSGGAEHPGMQILQGLACQQVLADNCLPFLAVVDVEHSTLASYREFPELQGQALSVQVAGEVTLLQTDTNTLELSTDGLVARSARESLAPVLEASTLESTGNWLMSTWTAQALINAAKGTHERLGPFREHPVIGTLNVGDSVLIDHECFDSGNATTVYTRPGYVDTGYAVDLNDCNLNDHLLQGSFTYLREQEVGKYNSGAVESFQLTSFTDSASGDVFAATASVRMADLYYTPIVSRRTVTQTYWQASGMNYQQGNLAVSITQSDYDYLRSERTSAPGFDETNLPGGDADLLRDVTAIEWSGQLNVSTRGAVDSAWRVAIPQPVKRLHREGEPEFTDPGYGSIVSVTDAVGNQLEITYLEGEQRLYALWLDGQVSYRLLPHGQSILKHH